MWSCRGETTYQQMDVFVTPGMGPGLISTEPCSTLNLKQLSTPCFALTAHDHSCLSQQPLLSVSAAGDAPGATAAAGLSKAIASWTLSRSSSWLLYRDSDSQLFPRLIYVFLLSPQGATKTRKSMYTDWDICLLGRQQTLNQEATVFKKALQPYNKSGAHKEWELMKLSSVFSFHNPTGMWISCGLLTAKTHKYTHPLRTIMRRCVGREEFSGCLLFYDAASWISCSFNYIGTSLFF